MATVELAAALPVLLLFMLAGVFGVQVADAHARAADAAGQAARAAARGDARGAELAGRAVSGRASVSITSSGDYVVATVRVRVRPYRISLSTVTVTERATALREPDADDSLPNSGRPP